MVGYNCFIIFLYYYLNIKILKFYENWNFCYLLKILKIQNFLKIFISYENSNIFKNFWNLEIFKNFWNIDVLNFFLLILEFWNFMKILKELFPFWGTQWVVSRLG
jgi:hypothetical protein